MRPAPFRCQIDETSRHIIQEDNDCNCRGEGREREREGEVTIIT